MRKLIITKGLLFARQCILLASRGNSFLQTTGLLLSLLCRWGGDSLEDIWLRTLRWGQAGLLPSPHPGSSHIYDCGAALLGKLGKEQAWDETGHCPVPSHLLLLNGRICHLGFFFLFFSFFFFVSLAKEPPGIFGMKNSQWPNQRRCNWVAQGLCWKSGPILQVVTAFWPGVLWKESTMEARHQCLTPVIPATQEAVIGRIAVWSQPRQIVFEILSLKKKT
jgi:hypothetical protein